MALTILCVSFTLLLLLGVPVAFSIGLSSLATILYEGLPLAVGFQQQISGMNPRSFLAIPFFICGRNHDVRRHCRPHRGLCQKPGEPCAAAWACRATCWLVRCLAASRASPVADVSAMGAVLIPQMKKEGYHADYAVNVDHARLAGGRAHAHLAQLHRSCAGRRGRREHCGADPGWHRARRAVTICNLLAAYLRCRARLPCGLVPWLGDCVILVCAPQVTGLAVVVIIIAGILSGPSRPRNRPR